MSGHHFSQNWRDDARAVVRGLPVILVILGLSLVAEEEGVYDGMEGVATDTFARLDPGSPYHDLVIVDIDERSYNELFQGRSPLAPAALKVLVDAVMLGGPRVVGVDLETSDVAFAGIDWSSTYGSTVWAQDGWVEPGPDEDKMHVGGVLGQPAGSEVAGRRSGLTLMPVERDGVIRKYARTIEVDGAARDTLPIALVRLAGKNVQAAEGGHGTEDTALFNFRADDFAFMRIPANTVLEAAKGEAFGTNGPLTGRVVVIGGSYRTARDRYVTSVGGKDGVELVAQAFATEMAGRGITPFNHRVALLLDFLASVAMVVVHHRMRPLPAMAISVTTVGAVAVGGSWIAYHTAAFWFSFVPPLVTLAVHQLYDRSREYLRWYEMEFGAPPATTPAPVPPLPESAPEAEIDVPEVPEPPEAPSASPVPAHTTPSDSPVAPRVEDTSGPDEPVSS